MRVSLNKHVSLDIFEVPSRTRTKKLPTYWEDLLVKKVRSLGVITETIVSIGYIANKRAFNVVCTNGKLYFIRVLFPSNLPLPYVIRRIIGQNDCCAKAHTLGDNLATKSPERLSVHGRKFGVYDSTNLIPCKQCFDAYEQASDYIDHVDHNRHPLFKNVDLYDFNLFSNLVLVWLISSTEPQIDAYVSTDEHLFTAYRSNNLKSTNKYLKNIAAYCRSVIKSAEMKEDSTSVTTMIAMRELQGTMNSCIDLCGYINNTPVESISLDDCYAFSEYMSRFRHNTQNTAFALRYSGNECELSAEDNTF